MSSILLNVIIYGVLTFFIIFIAYGLYGYAKQVFKANRR
jgi:hypothetical protein